MKLPISCPNHKLLPVGYDPGKHKTGCCNLLPPLLVVNVGPVYVVVIVFEPTVNVPTPL